MEIRPGGRGFGTAKKTNMERKYTTVSEAIGSQTAKNWNPILGDVEASSIIASLGQIEQQMPFLTGLSLAGRQRLAKVGDGTRPFVQDTVATALANPGIVPRSVDLEDLRARAATLEHLAEIQRALRVLNEKVSDTATKLGSELYGVARSVYSVMKTPATVPGLTERKAKLGQRFARKKGRQPSERSSLTSTAAQ